MFSPFWHWLEALPYSTSIRESLWLFPTLECIHLYSMILLVSIFSIFDLRLMGFSLGEPSEPLSSLSHRLLRWGWACFGINALTGFLIFSSEAVKMTGNWAFQLKMVLIVVALLVHSLVLRMAIRWEGAPSMPLSAKFVGTFSLLLWVGIIAASRWIAFVTSALLLR
jgi:Family of unknown function (DUF6644)